jgi:phosphatidylcholine synthase
MAVAMFLPLKFIHPVRTKRWRVVSLPVALAWTFFAGWAAWVDFHPESWAHWGLIADQRLPHVRRHRNAASASSDG